MFKKFVQKRSSFLNAVLSLIFTRLMSPSTADLTSKWFSKQTDFCKGEGNLLDDFPDAPSAGSLLACARTCQGPCTAVLFSETKGRNVCVAVEAYQEDEFCKNYGEDVTVWKLNVSFVFFFFFFFFFCK